LKSEQGKEGYLKKNLVSLVQRYREVDDREFAIVKEIDRKAQDFKSDPLRFHKRSRKIAEPQEERARGALASF